MRVRCGDGCGWVRARGSLSMAERLDVIVFIVVFLIALAGALHTAGLQRARTKRYTKSGLGRRGREEEACREIWEREGEGEGGRTAQGSCAP